MDICVWSDDNYCLPIYFDFLNVFIYFFFFFLHTGYLHIYFKKYLCARGEIVDVRSL